MYIIYNSNFNFKTNTKYLASSKHCKYGLKTINENNKTVIFQMLIYGVI